MAIDEPNVKCDDLRELVVSLHLELRQLRSAAAPCEGRTASEWHSYSVDLQEGYAQLAKELRRGKIAESDELRLLNQGLEKVISCLG